MSQAKSNHAASSAGIPKILLIDIETFPNLGYIWGKYQQDVIRYTRQTCIATVASKWLSVPGVNTLALPDYKGYRPGSYDDRALTHDLWKLLDEADVVVAHNGDSFDVKVIQSRFVVYGMKPTSPFKTVDTKTLAKHVARFNSNRLDDLGALLFDERKIKTDFDLWEGCINGDAASWTRTVDYNKRDVEILEKLYLRLRPWHKTHPNCGVYLGEAVCPKCGSQNLQARGSAITLTRVYQRWQCQDCGGWTRSAKSEPKRAVTLVNCA